MADITTRAGKGSPLTNDEVDANFTNLNTEKAESGANTDITSMEGLSGGIASAQYVDFDLAATVARASGRLTWNNTDGCLEVGVIGSEVTQQLGQEVLMRAYNAEVNPIENGQVVYFHSTSEQLVSVKEFIGDGTIDPHLVVGVATETIAAGGYGYVCEFGLVRGLNTAAFNPGDVLYASPSTAGDIVNTQPTPPNNILHIGFCIESDSTDGIILINQHDVPNSNEVRYDNADSNLLATNVKSALDELDLVKADLDLLTSNVTFYKTNANDPVIVGYKQAVTSTVDPSFDETAVDFLISGISNTATLSQVWISDANVLSGTVAGVVVPFVGNFRKDSGSGNARFYFEIYIRDDADVETLLAASSTSDYITATSYQQISLSATITLQEFTETDRVVLKLYSQTDSSTANYEMQLGGSSPFRALFPVPVSVVPSVAVASNITTDTTAFNGILSSSESSVQAALDVLDDHGHQLSDITGVTASNISTTTTGFDGVLSATEDDVQKALNVLDDITLQNVVDNGSTVTGSITLGSVNVDNVTIDGNTISTTNVDGDLTIAPNGLGTVIIDAADIGGGVIDGATIGATVPDTGDFTTLSADSASFTTVTNLGSVTTADINGGTIDGVTISATQLDVDNIRIDSNAITSTNSNGNISITPNGFGTVQVSNVDVAGGEIDGTAIGANAASTGAFTNLTASGTVNLAGATVSDLGSVTTADINGGTIDGADITVGVGNTLNLVNGTLSLADDQISGAKIDGGVISNFASTGIDDNASSTSVTITSGNNVGVGVTDADEKLEVNGDAKVGATGDAGRLHLGLTSDETNIVGRGSSHATLPSTLDVQFGGAAAARFRPTGFNVVGDITLNGTVDGRDVNADGTKLDGIDVGAQVNVGTNLSFTADGTQLQVNSSTGNNVDLPAATTSAWGVMTDDDKSKLDGVAVGATNTAVPAIEDVAGTPTLATGITAAEVRTAIGAGTSSSTGTVTSVTGGAGLTGTVTTTGSLAVGAGTGIAVNTNDVALAASGPGAATYGSTANGTKIDTIEVDAYGRVVSIATGPTGTSSTDNNTTYTLTAAQTGGTDANPNLFLNASSGTDYNVSLTGGVGIDVNRTADSNITFTVDLSELTDMTADVVGTDELVLLDAGADRRKAISEIKLSNFNNDAQWNNYVHPAYNGDDFSVDTGALTGATVVSDIDINVTTDALGHVVDANGVVATRTLTLANLGYTGDANANNYLHPTFTGDDINIDTGALTGATVISDLDFNITTNGNGHVTDANAAIATRNLTAADIGAAPAGGSLATNWSCNQLTADSGAVITGGDIVLGTANGTNWIVQDCADLSTERAGWACGESGKFGAATMHMYYTGDGKFHIGMGTMSDTTHAAFRAMEFQYQTTSVTFLGNIIANGTVDGRDVAADGTKLDGIASGAQVNVGTNITVSEGATTVAINSSTGSDDSIAAATTSLAGVMTATDKSKLNGIATGATNTAAPAITSNGSTPSLASGITAAEVRSLIGAGTSSTTGTVTSVSGGNGLTGSVTTSGSLAVGAGTGISVAADTVGLAADQRLASGNNPLIGATTSYCSYQSSSATKYARWYLEADEDMRLTEGGALICNGNVTANSTTIASDARLKDNVKDFVDPLSKVLQLRTVTFTWNDQVKHAGKEDIGFIAQEVQKVVPEFVQEVDVLGTLEEKRLSVDYAKMSALNTGAIQQLYLEIAKLKAEIEQLKAK